MPLSSPDSLLGYSTWDTASEGTIYGSLIIKAQPLLDFIEQQRKLTGKKITITHCCLKCFGLVLRDNPTVNGRLVSQHTRMP